MLYVYTPIGVRVLKTCIRFSRLICGAHSSSSLLDCVSRRGPRATHIYTACAASERTPRVRSLAS